jgi:hypothetical protein
LKVTRIANFAVRLNGISRIAGAAQCCSVLPNSVRRVLVIAGDEQTFELPIGYEERLQSFLDNHI